MKEQFCSSLFSGEEFGLKGSYNLSSKINPEKIKALVNIEMIGRGLYDDHHNPYITGDSCLDLRNILNDQLQKQVLAPAAKKIEFGKDRFIKDNLFRRSDNFPNALQGIPAHSIMLTFPSDSFYHSVNDEVETLDFEDMSLIIKAIALSYSGLVTGKNTLSGIDPKKL